MKRAESTDLAERRRAERALRESEEKYRSLFDSIDAGFCIIEVLFEGNRAVDYVFLELNPAFERQTGIVNGVGRRMRDIAPDHEEHWFQTYGKVAKTGESVKFQNRARALERFFDVFTFRIGYPEQHRVAVLFNDITEQKRAADTLRESEARLRESDRRKDEFLAMLGHELRNPLAAIRSATELLKLMLAEDSRIERAVGVLDRQSAHMARLIDGLLEISRIARGKIRLTRETLDARDVVRGVVQDRRAQVQGMKLTERLPPQPVWIDADRARVTQVLDNLVGNAIKFTDAGGSIQVTLAAEGSHAVFRVRDTGVGMRPEVIERLFEPFQQESQELARSAGGLGLGLAVAKGLVELHDGDIEAYSAGLETGTELQVRLPLAAQPAAAQAEATAKVSTLRIMIVEDNADAGQALRDLLERLGHTVEVVGNGPDALDALSRRGADVVLCDLGLPGMNGYAVARAVRRHASLADTRLIAVTGYGQPEDLRRATEAGFDAHLVKPVDVQRLYDALRGPSGPCGE